MSALEQVFRVDWGRVLASLVGYLGDIEMAEEAVQEAFASAAERSPRDGSPDNPTGWLIATARTGAIDRIQQQRTLTAKTKHWNARRATDRRKRWERRSSSGDIPDERLELIFACCHPALALDAQVGLTLHTLSDLSTEEIEQALFVAPETMRERLTRAKHKIRDTGIRSRSRGPSAA